ncbi:alpha/beta hydrolase [Nocardioides donggukensis]|uniref:Alpha/beta hydrolase n=1 Tax=Nocardioides donggukensis TaxID=2774019 RepID=A0A927K3Y2_9ACTN|nr:alpha/beta hydrolase [Nocardioides donggukensis]MBD8868343.1 alpha/beta hydrolase [Nocardioides donggukensis]
MPLDPGLAGLLTVLEDPSRPAMHEGTPDQARDAFRALSRIAVAEEGPVEVGSVEDREVAGRPARVYRPVGPEPRPTVLFLHGGGFVVGGLDTHDSSCRRLCRDVDTVVVAVDYRLAPEHPFPAAVEDSVAAARHLQQHLAELGGTDRLGVAGDSAGGNLAAVVSQRVPGLTAQLLVYPATDAFGEHGSRSENGARYFLDLPTMAWFLGHYLTDVELAERDGRLSPVHGDLAGLPPAVVATAEFDPLRDEGEAYAAALREAGGEVDLVRYDGLIHGFLDMGAFSPAAATAVSDVHARFRALLHR